MTKKRVANFGVVAVLAVTTVASGETRKEIRFSVGPKACVTITNQYGPISVKPGPSNQIVVTAVLHSDKVEVDQSQSGNRVEIVSHILPGADAEAGRVDYEVLVPADSCVALSSSTGTLHAERLSGEVSIEGATPEVEVREASNGHVHVTTMNGPITLSNLHGENVDVTSVSGDIRMTAVDGPIVKVNSTSGNIHYDGEFGAGGEYIFSSHTGDIEATAPGYASIDVVARSVKGQVDNDFPLQPRHTAFAMVKGSAFAGTMNKAGSSVKLSSFSGKIHLKKR